MALLEEIIEADPVMQRVFSDQRRFAPKRNHAAIVSCLEADISEKKVALYKAKTIELAEYLQRQIRYRWFSIRLHCDGYVRELPDVYSDKCEHVVMFRYRNSDAELEIDYRARAALWHRHAGRPPPRW